MAYVSPETLRSWYNKSEDNYRGLKQLAGWLVAYWQRLAFNAIKFVLDRIAPGFTLVSELHKRGVITSDELETICQFCEATFHELIPDAIDCIKDAPLPNVNNGWNKLDIDRLLRRVSPFFEK